ncbi:hypothetical protein [Acinetobacter sp. ANC5681]|uniref:hypothetical protein n=1 Tax=Acinetobacter sp. ANC5681 TaxID=2929504 RepID=UPI00201AA334|nr:hypothetical protein [Acinetobacter sp. ANC5681]MCL5768672.1 hypothetical protein [Acinetobacter sp. ANC5681]
MTKDIEREAFEEALAGNKIHNLKVCTIFDDEKNEYFASDVCDPSEDHIVESINLSWRMWQAAKAQAVPDGFVVVNQKDLLELAIAINAVDLATHTESKTNEVREMWQQVALKLMVLCTAQEPTND